MSYNNLAHLDDFHTDLRYNKHDLILVYIDKELLVIFLDLN